MDSINTCTIETEDGLVCGYIDTNNKNKYYKFKSIPYARPPVGLLRFRPPLPVTPWTGKMDCTQDSPFAFSYNSMLKEILGSEDCLYIELSTPNIKPDKLLPVMFWIGTYIFSVSIDEYLDPSLLNDQGVVFVRCGFRLGPFGFLSINDFSAPGNCGLKDIVMALKWVQKNIAKFGGDPNNVTIFGSSSGGSAVHLLMLSPMAKGLFHKAISQSSTAFNNWSLGQNPTQQALELTEMLGITKSNNIEVIEELRSVPAEDIMHAFVEMESKLSLLDTRDIFNTSFKPCIEDDYEGVPAFLTKSPMAIIKSGNFNKVPLLIGSNNIEANILEYIKSNFYDEFEKYNENVSLLVPRSLSLHDTKVSKNIGQKLLKFYLADEDKLTENNKSQYLQLISDYYFLYYVNKTVRAHAEFASECPVFYYIFNCPSDWTVPEDLQFLTGLCHSSELPFIFKIKSPDASEAAKTSSKGSRESILTRQRVVKMWTNFARCGNPTPDEDDPLLEIKWDPVENKDKLNYLSIGTELTKGRNPFRERMNFWEEIHTENSLLRMLVHFTNKGISC
uniref:Carboxylic ester hydrolase n=1 Tax=Ostrinia furnacalis TaxID=93504 RepID=A0A0F7QHK9_OSTFU|nr:carboxylesterase [Ostrinia furnacalis]